MAKIRAGISAEDAIEKIKSMYNPANVAGMARYGINSHDTYGVSIPTLRIMAKEIGKDHGAALKLWKSGIHRKINAKSARWIASDALRELTSKAVAQK